MEELMERSVKLGAARALAGLKQDDAAKKLGVTVYMLKRYEHYEQVLPLDIASEMVRLYRIPARYIDFGCDMRYLLG